MTLYIMQTLDQSSCIPISEHVFPVYPSAHLQVLLAMQAPLSQGGSQTTLKWITIVKSKASAAQIYSYIDEIHIFD